MFDDRDAAILSILQSAGRTPNAEIARRLGMAPSAILERIRKLERGGTIQAYEARLDPAAVGLGVTAFAFVTAIEPVSEIKSGAALAEIPELSRDRGPARRDRTARCDGSRPAWRDRCRSGSRESSDRHP